MTKEQKERLAHIIDRCKSEAIRAADLRSDLLAAKRFAKDSASMTSHAIARMEQVERSLDNCLQAWALYRDEFEFILNEHLNPPM